MPAKQQVYSASGADAASMPSGVDVNQWSMNPYAKFDYTHTWWQKLWEGLGFRSKFNDYQDSMALNAREYEAQLAEKAHNEQFESPVEQVARQRAAGLNPDLNGGVDSGSASPMQPDPNGPIEPGFNDPATIVQGFGNMVMSAFTGAIGLANSVVGMLGNMEDLTSKKISNYQGIVAQAIDLVHNNVPAVYSGDGMPTLSGNGFFSDMADSFADDAGFSSREKRKFIRAVENYARSAPASADAYKSWYEQGENRSQYAKLRGSDYFSDVDATLFDLIEPLCKAWDKILKLEPEAKASQLGAEGAQAEYSQEYYNSLDPSLAGEVENTTNRRNLASSQIDSILNEALSEIVTNLRDRSESGKKGHGFATVAVLVFSVLRMMNFSRTTGISGGKPVNTTSFGF